MFCGEKVGNISYDYQKNEVYWLLPNYFTDNANKTVETCLYSPPFSYENATCHLVLIRNSSKNSSDIGLFIWSNSFIDSCSITLGLKTANGGVYEVCEGKLDVDRCFGMWNFVNLSEISQDKKLVSRNGFLKFFCGKGYSEVPILNDVSQLSEEVRESEKEVAHEDSVKSEEPEVKGVDRLVQNLKNLLQDGQSSDTILKAEDREFRVHRAILIARSPVFASMFQHDMTEKASGVIDVPDCSAAAFEVFLLYIYTGSADTISPDNVFNLYYAADKYQVVDLKAECVEYMQNSLSVDTFCDVITLSLRHSESDLRKAATHFFCQNVKKIIKTVQWQRYLKEYPTQANELYIKAIDA